MRRLAVWAIQLTLGTVLWVAFLVLLGLLAHGMFIYLRMGRSLIR